VSGGAARHAGTLAVGTIVAGIAAYAYIALGTRHYGAAAFAPVAVVFALWPAAAAAFGFPLEQWIARQLATGPEGEAVIRSALRAAVPIIVVICLVAGLVVWAAGDRLFGERGLLYPAVIVVVSLGAASMGILRGGLAGRGQYFAASLATALENLVRLGPALIVLAIGWGIEAYAAVLMIGSLVGVLWPVAFRYRGGGRAGRTPGRGLGQLAGASLLAQTVLTAPPIVLAVIVGPQAAVTAMFATLALLRAPYLVAVGVSVRGVPSLTRRLAGATAAALGGLLARVAAVTAVASGLAALVAPLVLPAVVGLVFGDDTVPSDGALSGLAAGVVAAHGALVSTVILVAAGRHGVILWGWLIALAANAALLLTGFGDELRVAVAFAGAEIVAVLAMAAGARFAMRPLPGPARAVP
jgi:O-antigen/teichoic acid export membrane protein